MKTLLIAFILLVATLATAAPAAKQKMKEVCLYVHAVSLIGGILKARLQFLSLILHQFLARGCPKVSVGSWTTYISVIDDHIRESF